MFRYTPLHWSQNQTPYSPKFQDHYFSQQGGLEESQHVFLQGNQLAKRWQKLESSENFVIGELGFGTGLNFLTTWLLWKQHPSPPKTLHYISCEAHPLNPQDMEKVYTAYSKNHPQLQKQWKELETQLPQPLPGFHRLFFEGGQVVLTLLYGEAAQSLPNLNAQVDAWFLDGFTPAKNPELWSSEVLSQVARLTKSQGTFATYTAAGGVRRKLEELGFAVEKRKGFGSKRECMVGKFSGSAKSRRGRPLCLPSMNKGGHAGPPLPISNSPDHPNPPPNKSAIIIGAGLAGCSLTHSLIQRGWQVTLIERHKDVAQEASGGQAGILFPYFSVDWDLKSEFYWSGFFFTMRLIESLFQQGHHIPTQKKDMIILPRYEDSKERYQRISQNLDPEGNWLSFLSAEKLAKKLNVLVGLKAKSSGIYFKQARWVSPQALCQALIVEIKKFSSKTKALFRFIKNTEVLDFSRQENVWSVSTQHEKNIVEAPVLILANAFDVKNFSLTQNLELQKVRGQTTQLPSSFLEKSPETLLNYGGYLIPLPDGTYEMGASFEREDERAELLPESHQSNLDLFSQAFPECKISQEILENLEKLSGRVAWRTVRKNRWPLIGLFSDPLSSEHPDLYLHTAHGSKGLLSCPLGSEYLASYLNGEPLPLSKNVVQKLIG